MSPKKATTSTKPAKRTAALKRESSAGKSRANFTGKSLVIVESPTKARTLDKYLGKEFKVLASGGHVIDLPEREIGVDIEDGFKPRFVKLPGRQKILAQLVAAAEDASSVYLATDPDREGEAIAWHIKNEISKRAHNGIYRVQFHEITRSAVAAAMQSPGEIDSQKVDAQIARRIMDRLVGYQVSPILWKTITRGLSAGRVQSVALRLICEREELIKAFVPVEYWNVTGTFSGKGVPPFAAKLAKLDGQKINLPNQEVTDAVVRRLRDAEYTITDLNVTRRKRQPMPPYITSTMQQDAGRRLGFTVKKTMALAQHLYEGVEIGEKGMTGLITYMRTDSIRVAGEAIDALRKWVAGKYGEEYLCDKPRVYKNKKGAVQDAHEAVRPTDVSLTPDLAKKYLTPDLFKLYDLIWRRFAATQMHEAEIDVTTALIGDGKAIEFRASGQVIVFQGFLAVYADSNDNGDSDDDSTTLPSGLNSGMPLSLDALDPLQHFTQPPPRFNESSLVKELDELGIGRPSTYASIISTLIDRKYATRQSRAFLPTELGETVNRILVDRFPKIFNVEFTAKMEDELDRIETGVDKLEVLNDFYGPFGEALRAAEGMRGELKKETLKAIGRQCPEDGGELVYRWGRRGKFISCSNYPTCKYSENIEPLPPAPADAKCPICGSPMIVREGKFGRFLGCSTYPKCKGILPMSTGFKCPRENCDGELTERRTKKGRVFYGCNRYPKCDFVSWDAPVAGPCPDCSSPTLFLKKRKDGESTECRRCHWKSEA